jgi:hypothetical protein
MSVAVGMARWRPDQRFACPGTAHETPVRRAARGAPGVQRLRSAALEFIGVIQRLSSGVLNPQEHARALTYQALVDPSR